MRVGASALGAGVVAAALMMGGCGSSGKTANGTVSGATSTTRSTSTTSTTTAPVTDTTLLADGSQGVHFTVDGTFKGQAVKGRVQSGSLRCTPITTGGKQGMQLTWGGTVNGTGQISGDLMFAGGQPSITFGDSHSQGEASIVVKGDYADRYGASSALGSGTATSNGNTSGAINAQLDGGSAGMIRLQGTWTC